VGHNWTIFHSTAGPALAVRDGAVMSASTGPAPGRRGMLTGTLAKQNETATYCNIREVCYLRRLPPILVLVLVIFTWRIIAFSGTPV